MLNQTRLHTRRETIEILKFMLHEGYRYVVRDKEMNYLCCFSCKPKKYEELESWGYADKDIRTAKSVYSFKNEDVMEVNWNNKNAILIEEWLVKQ